MAGSQPRLAANRMIRRMPSQKSGIESPRKAMKVTPWSIGRPRLSAETSPAGIAIRTDTTKASTASENVRGAASIRSWLTGMREP